MGNNEQLLEYRLCNGTYQHHLQPMEDLQRIQSLCKFQEKSRIKSGLPRIQPLKIWLKVRFGLQVLKSSWQWFCKCSSGNRSQTVDRLHHVTSIIFTAVLRSYTLSNQFCAGGQLQLLRSISLASFPPVSSGPQPLWRHWKSRCWRSDRYRNLGLKTHFEETRRFYTVETMKPSMNVVSFLSKQKDHL